MGATDTEEVLRHEIIESKQELEQGLGAKVISSAGVEERNLHIRKQLLT